ncbi:MAG: hypothetical protein ACRC28_18650 [Clostridium sp.]|uniref:hypothetical protein n=1 Tax=Clostridium sp. TaxID=1506 RepID=UPI003F2A25E7
MKKSDLKSGMIVELRDGTNMVLIGDRFIGEASYLSISNMQDNLTCGTTGVFKSCDIMKVYNSEICYFHSVNTHKKSLLWEREKEIDWSKVPIGTKVEVRDRYTQEWKECSFLIWTGDVCSDVYCFLTYSESSTDFWQQCRIAGEIKEEWCK